MVRTSAKHCGPHLLVKPFVLKGIVEAKVNAHRLGVRQQPDFRILLLCSEESKVVCFLLRGSRCCPLAHGCSSLKGRDLSHRSRSLKIAMLVPVDKDLTGGRGCWFCDRVPFFEAQPDPLRGNTRPNGQWRRSGHMAPTNSSRAERCCDLEKVLVTSPEGVDDLACR
jgi:hypothetical protein